MMGLVEVQLGGREVTVGRNWFTMAVNLVPKRKQFVQERNEKYRRKFAEDERDEIENLTPAR